MHHKQRGDIAARGDGAGAARPTDKTTEHAAGAATREVKENVPVGPRCVAGRLVGTCQSPPIQSPPMHGARQPTELSGSCRR
eukprot:363939-Chlamydomonas_euryale.AAC.3